MAELITRLKRSGFRIDAIEREQWQDASTPIDPKSKVPGVPHSNPDGGYWWYLASCVGVSE